MKISLLTTAPPMRLQTIYIHKPSDVLYKLRASLLHARAPSHRLKHFWVISLTGSNLVTHVNLLSIGSRTYSMISMSDTFRAQILNQAKKLIIVCSCYGSGAVIPTRSELAKVSEFSVYGNLIGIPVIDYVIISEQDYYSHGQQTTLPGYKVQQ